MLRHWESFGLQVHPFELHQRWHDWQQELLNHTLMKVGPIPVYTISEVTSAFSHYNIMTHDSITIMVTPHLQDEKYQDDSMQQMATDQLHVIHCV